MTEGDTVPPPPPPPNKPKPNNKLRTESAKQPTDGLLEDNLQKETVAIYLTIITAISVKEELGSGT